MTPNYNTFECEFAFGRTPPPPEENEALRRELAADREVRWVV